MIVAEVLAELGLEDIAPAAIAKGPDRNAGREGISKAVALKSYDHFHGAA